MVLHQPNEDRVMRNFKRSGQLPKAFRERPEVLPGLGSYMKAFLELSTCRQFTMVGAGPISWESIDRYAVANDYGDGEERDELFDLVRALDNEYLKLSTEK